MSRLRKNFPAQPGHGSAECLCLPFLIPDQQKRFFCSFCATWDGAGTSSDAYSECAYLPLPLIVQDSCCTHWASCILVPASGFEPNQCSFAHMLFRFNNSCEMPEIQLPSQKHKPFECPSLSEKRRALDPQLRNFDHHCVNEALA